MTNMEPAVPSVAVTFLARDIENDVPVTVGKSVTVGFTTLGGILVILVVLDATVPTMVGTGGDPYTPIVWGLERPGSEKTISYWSSR